MTQDPGNATLRVSASIVTELLGRHIEQGEGLIEQANFIGEVGEHERWRAARHQWIELTVRTLSHIYDGSEQLDNFRGAAAAPPDGQPWQVECKRDAANLQGAVDLLISFKDGLEHDGLGRGDDDESDSPDASDSSDAPEPAPVVEAEPRRKSKQAKRTATVGSELAPAPTPGAALEQAAPVPAATAHEVAPGVAASLSGRTAGEVVSDGSGRVFVVHGRNDSYKQVVASLLARTGAHEVTILNERPGDRTLVEHFAEHPPGSRYAIVLLTADDIGAPRVDSDREPFYSPRAHQEVVFAMGILVAALTPRFVCVLYEDGVDLPCDLDGITYVRLDGAGSWQTKLLLGLRGAGFDYDLNRLAA